MGQPLSGCYAPLQFAHAATCFARVRFTSGNAGVLNVSTAKGKPMERDGRKRRTAHALATALGIALCVLIAPILVMNVTLIVKSAFGDEVPNVGGYFPLVVLTDSMSPAIESGDLAICRTATAPEVSAGDAIAFFDPMSTRAEGSASLVLHRVSEIEQAPDGSLQWVTKGDANNACDLAPVSPDDLAGRYVMKIPQVGSAVLFLQSPLGVLLCVAIPLAAIALIHIFRRGRPRRDRV